MKTLAFWSLAVALAVSGALGAQAVAKKASEQPEKVIIDDCKVKQPGVPFNHAAHARQLKIECVACHHTDPKLNAGANVEVKKCSECHLKPEKEGQPSCKVASLKANPFHITCVGCHKEKHAGPTTCTKCHVK